LDYPSGSQVTYQRDMANRPKVITVGGSTNLATYKYQGYTKVFERTDHANGKLSFTYNTKGLVATAKSEITGTGGHVVAHYDYTHDNLYNVVNRTDNIPATPVTDNFQYDLAERITSATVNGTPWNFTLDEQGNRPPRANY
jgi:hypothetical protein